MTPERLAELRMVGVAWCTESEFAALLDLVEAQRRALEKADVLSVEAREVDSDDPYRILAAADDYDEARKETKPEDPARP